MKRTTMTRRSMLGGLLTAGSLVALPESLAAADAGGFDPFSAAPASAANRAMATPAKPGLHYDRCSPTAFVPLNSTITYARTPIWVRHTSLGSQTFICPVELRHGSTLKEIEVYVDTGSAIAQFAVFRTDATFGFQFFGLTPVPVGMGIQTITVPLDLPIDLVNNSYLVAVAFDMSGTLYGARLGSLASTGLVTVPQTRKLDTRSGSKPLVGSITPVDLAPDVPVGASAALVNVTATQTVQAGFVTAFPGDLVTPPNTSTLNWTSPNVDIANTAVVELHGGTAIKLSVGGPAGAAAHLLCDVLGYFI